MVTATEAAPKVVRKSFTYRTSVEWLGRRAGMLSSQAKMPFRVASPPEFRGEPDVWSPEDLFVAAIDTCLMMTFASKAEKKQLAIDGYMSEAEGVLEFVGDGYQFTKVTVKPTILITDSRFAPEIVRTVQEAHRDCLVARSCSAEIIVQPDIELTSIE